MNLDWITQDDSDDGGILLFVSTRCRGPKFLLHVLSYSLSLFLEFVLFAKIVDGKLE
jgi:hypothetical protein